MLPGGAAVGVFWELDEGNAPLTRHAVARRDLVRLKKLAERC